MGTRSERPVVPVYMFHSVANKANGLPYGHLSTSVETFMRIAAYLHMRRFNTITLSNLYNYLAAGERLPPKPIVLTFDDGYLDNWVNAFPILAKHKLKATMFVVPEFVDPQSEVRPTLSHVWEKKGHRGNLSVAGFLSWNEIRGMQASGLIDIQSHSLTHTCRFQRPEIVDFHHPGDRYPWLAWNQYPERKYLWGREEQEEYVGFGAPVYGYGRALAGPQYFPDETLGKTLQEHVKQQGGRSFFRNPEWRQRLFTIADAHRRDHALKDGYESQVEYEQRVREELCGSKQVIEKELDKRIDFLCWPGGAFNGTTQRIAQESGYLATTKGTSKNTWGADAGRIHRIGGTVALTRNHQLLDTYISPLVFAAQVEAYRGNLLYAGLLHWSSRTVRAGRWVLGSLRQTGLKSSADGSGE